MKSNLLLDENPWSNTLDRWVEEHYDNCDWVLLGQEEGFEVIEVLSDVVVLDDYDNEHKGIVIVSKTEEE